MAFIRRIAAGLLLGVGFAGLSLRFTWRDSIEALAPFFYMLPLPLCGLLLLTGGVVARGRGRRLALVCGALTLASWFLGSYGFARPETGRWKFMTWNLQGPKQPFQPLLELVRRERPDFVSLIETRYISPDTAKAYENLLPGYHMMLLGGDRACLVRGEAGYVRDAGLPGRSHVVELRIKVGGEYLRVLVVDLDSNPLRSRAPALEWLAGTAAEEPRTVTLGDFNTPLDSAWLDSMRHVAIPATERWHSGFRETWPDGLPLLSLDQVWLSPDLKPVFARRIWTLASDHCPVIVDFDRR